jgi:hypothetical protein
MPTMKARRIAAGLIFTLTAFAIAVFFYARTQKPLLDVGVGYGARVACGCRYIGNRSLEDCRKDFEPGMEPIQLSEDVATKTVTASVPLVASRSARFDPVLGCVVEKLP